MTTNEHYSQMLGVDDAVHTEGLVKAQATSPMQELGATGVKRAGGIIDEEFLPALKGRRAVKVFREMSLNDPIVHSMLFTVEQLLRQVTWTVTTTGNTPEEKKAAEFVEQCMDDMSHTWNDMIAECLSFLPYGWSWHEIVYKKRVGPDTGDPRTRSKYTDAKIGWRKIPIRSQETMLRWVFDEDGGIKGMVQMAPPYYKMTVIPIERSLLFRARMSKGNPEGQSILRGSYRPWFLKKRLEEFEAIGVERDLAGMPVAYVPSDYMKAKKGSDKHRTYMAFKQMVQNVRRDEHEGLVLPNEFDTETKQPLFKFELLSAGGSRTFDTNALISRYEQRILQTILADFIMVGHEGSGSYAMHVDKTGIFRAALNSFAAAIADTFNRYAIPRLFEVNGWKMEEYPQLEPSNVDPPNLTELSSFMTSMSGLGMSFFPDVDLEKYLRDTAHLPSIPEDQMEMRREMADQQQLMEYAESRMQAAGALQRDQMVEEEGMSPDQAQMASQAPTAQSTAAEQIAQYKGAAMADQDPDVAAKKEEEAAAHEQELAEQEDMEESKFGREQEGKDADMRRQRMIERVKAAQRGRNGQR